MLRALHSHICITVCHVISSATNFVWALQINFFPLLYVSLNFHPCLIVAKLQTTWQTFILMISSAVSGFSKALGLIRIQTIDSSSMSANPKFQHVPNP